MGQFMLFSLFYIHLPHFVLFKVHNVYQNLIVLSKILLGQPRQDQWEYWVLSHARIVMMETGPPPKWFTGPPCAAVIQDYFSEYSCNETVSFPPRRRHLIITIVPRINMGILVSLNVMLMHLQTIRCKTLVYSIFHKKQMCLTVWKI
jgi:hypothetical protein